MARRESAGSTGKPGETKAPAATGKMIATLGSAYLGSIPVKQAHGSEVVAAAINALRRRGSRDAAVVQIGTEGIRVLDSLTEELLEKINLADITFAAPHRDANHDHMFAIIVKVGPSTR